MDPVAVIKTLWRFKVLVLPVVLLTMGAALFVYQFGPRAYESKTSYALVNPPVSPSSNPVTSVGLPERNGDNPYLRSPDPTLVTNVLITRLRAAGITDALEDAGLGTEYTVAPGIGGNGFIVDITGVGGSPEQSLATTNALGAMLEDELYAVQTVNGAGPEYLYTALAVAPPEDATERFSSRLRTVIVVVLGGLVLLFGAVSLGRGLEESAVRRRAGRVTAQKLSSDSPRTASGISPPGVTESVEDSGGFSAADRRP